MEAPFLYKDDKNLQWTLKEVVEMVDNLRQLSALDKILEASESKELFVEVPADLVNFLKMEMFNAGLHKNSEYARSHIASATRGRKCGGEPLAGGNRVGNG